jgi:hypothetical protein
MAGDAHPLLPELIAYLTERGKTPHEIDVILAKVAEYDERTINESFFDSIAGLTEFEIGRVLDLPNREAWLDGPEELPDR